MNEFEKRQKEKERVIVEADLKKLNQMFYKSMNTITKLFEALDENVKDEDFKRMHGKIVKRLGAYFVLKRNMKRKIAKLNKQLSADLAKTR